MAEIKNLRSANLWQTIFAATNDAMLLVDEHFLIRACNPRAQQLYGYTEQELVGMDLHNLRTEAKRPMLKEQLNVARRKGGLVYETEHVRRDGAILQVEVSTRPLKLGTRPGWVHAVRDISKRKQEEKEREDLLREAQEAVQARDMFLSVASHELKTPLTIIQGYAELLRRQLETAKPLSNEPGDTGQVIVNQGQLARRIENVYTATGRLTTLINELLDINRMERGALELNRERMDLTAMVSTVIQNAFARDQVSDHPRGVRIVAECPTTPIWGSWDHSRIEQVVTNLIDNAVKYSPLNSTVEVTLRVEPTDNGQQQAHLIVHDQGIGIPQEELGRIFQPFMRATNAARLRLPGLGLGLAITREIVEHHNGHIWVESQGMNMGSTFHVVLPGVEPVPEPIPQ